MNTTINWSTMTNRERDTFIAEHVFGHQVQAGLERGSETEPDYYFTDPVDGRLRSVSCYSTDLRIAWAVVRHFTVPVELTYTPGRDCCCTIRTIVNGPVSGIAETPADAICIAALKAVGCEVQA